MAASHRDSLETLKGYRTRTRKPNSIFTLDIVVFCILPSFALFKSSVNLKLTLKHLFNLALAPKLLAMSLLIFKTTLKTHAFPTYYIVGLFKIKFIGG